MSTPFVTRQLTAGYYDMIPLGRVLHHGLTDLGHMLVQHTLYLLSYAPYR